MKLTALIATCLVVCSNGCGGVTGYSLDEDSFGADTLARIEREAGIDLPDGAKGLAFLYKPPIDPIVFAKITIPDSARSQIEEQLVAAATNDDYPQDFANDVCGWWPASFDNTLLSKLTFYGGYYVEYHLIEEDEQIVLYLKYFTL